MGLARSERAQQIMSKLPIFTNNQLQQLVREPILQDKRASHVKFQQHAYHLIELVLGPAGSSKTSRTLGQQVCVLTFQFFFGTISNHQRS